MKQAIPGFLLACALASSPAWAQSPAPYPTRPVRIIVPYAPGGVTDIMARVIGVFLGQQMGQPFVVENKAGAGGVVGMTEVFRAPHDGYTLAMMPANLSVMPDLYQHTPFNPLKDFVPIINVGSSPVGISVHSSFPAQDFKSLIAYAQNHNVNYASCGIASPQHIAAEYLRSITHIQITHIPYKGCGEAIPDVLSGEVPLFFASIPHIINQQKTGKIRAIAITGKSRSDMLPGVPTVAELGHPEYDVDAWFGLIAAKGTPPEIIKRLNEEVNKALQLPEVKEKMAAQYFEPVGGTPESFGVKIMDDARKLGAIVKEAHIRAE